MIKLDNYSKYFSADTGEFLIENLSTDLQASVERVHDAASAAVPKSTTALLQPTRNSLRPSVEQIAINGKPFFTPRGQCMGASAWFAALFLQLKKKYPEMSTLACVSLIAKEFEEGVGIAPAYIQKTYQDTQIHEKIEKCCQFQLEKKSAWDFEVWDVIQYDEKLAEFVKNISELEDGVYLLSFSGAPESSEGKEIPGHATVVIVEKKNYYFFDPNEGATCAGPDVGSENKVRDATSLLAICSQYLPLARARAHLQKRLKKLEPQFGQTVVACLDKIVGDLIDGKRRVALCAYEIYAIYNALKAKAQGRDYTEKHRDALLIALCIKPVTTWARLVASAKLNVSRFTS